MGTGWLRDMIGTDKHVSGDAQRAADHARAALDVLVAERDRYRAALEFYANSESYETETRPMWSRAREALKEGAVT